MTIERVATLLAGERISIDTSSPAGAVDGGDISQAWRVESDAGSLFLKTGPATSFDMFLAESEGLAEIRSTQAVRVPGVIACLTDDGLACLALEWLNFDKDDGRASRLLGCQLAEMHKHTSNRFGWYRDNTIGLTPQHNDRCNGWVDFFRDRRLGFQLELAGRNGYGTRLASPGTELLHRMGSLFENYEPVPSLLHGDLWGGNWASCSGRPAIFDPAVYYGDRETDLAMTRLFGGFGSGFYEAYEDTWPLADGHQKRCTLYQLYHVLNHLNLFGGAYLAQAEAMMRELL